MNIVDGVIKLIEKNNLTEEEMYEVLNYIMDGQATNAQIASFLTALKIKGESIEEITACAKVMREKSERIAPKLDYFIDTCGTGGDGANTFNISTIVAIVAASAGVAVAKHGNRSVSSKCGSADVLEALGVNIDLDAKVVEASIEEVGIGFMFAQSFHKSMKHAMTVRKELGFRTIFNILGPLTNPANAKGQIIGVFDEGLVEPIARVLKNLGVEKAMVVHGFDGSDELTITDKSYVSEICDGEIISYALDPLKIGIKRANPMDLIGGDATQNARIIHDILSGEEKGAKLDVVLLNAGAAIYIGKKAESIEEGVNIAREAINSGKALSKLTELISFTNRKA